MWVLILGVGILMAVWTIFWLKDRMESVKLQRLAYHEMTARFAVVGAMLAMAGLVLIAGDLLEALGVDVPSPFEREEDPAATPPSESS